MRLKTDAEWARYQRMLERDAILRKPGGRALLHAERFYQEERRVLERLDLATDEEERKRLLTQAQEYRRIADESAKEARSLTMTATAKQIREAAKKRLNAIAQQLALIPASEDQKYPEDHRETRRDQRAKLEQSWRTIEQQSHAELAAWADGERATAQALYASQPVGTPQEESRRVADLLEAQGLAQRFSGQPRAMIVNHLVDGAKQFLASGNIARARVYSEAAKQLGVDDGALDRDLNEALDKVVPTRRQGREQLAAIEVETEGLDRDLVSARIQNGVGDQIANSNSMKILLARAGEQVPVGLVSSAEVGAGAGDGGASS